MQRTSHGCAHCSQLLALSSDMWGLYYLCADCGWTCEDDDQIPKARRSVASMTPGLLGGQEAPSVRPQRSI